MRLSEEVHMFQSNVLNMLQKDTWVAVQKVVMNYVESEIAATKRENAELLGEMNEMNQVRTCIYICSFLKTPWCESASELYRPSVCRLSAKLVPTFADRGCHLVSVTGPHGHILGFLDRSCYLFFQVEWTPFQTHYFFFSW
jgi:hypothetical protein